MVKDTKGRKDVEARNNPSKSKRDFMCKGLKEMPVDTHHLF